MNKWIIEYKDGEKEDLYGIEKDGYLITRYPVDISQSNNGGDYHEGYNITDPDTALGEGLISANEAEEAYEEHLMCLIYNHMLFSDFSHQGKTLEGMIREITKEWSFLFFIY